VLKSIETNALNISYRTYAEYVFKLFSMKPFSSMQCMDACMPKFGKVVLAFVFVFVGIQRWLML
jgi:hypothetical protein